MHTFVSFSGFFGGVIIFFFYYSMKLYILSLPKLDPEYGSPINTTDYVVKSHNFKFIPFLQSSFKILVFPLEYEDSSFFLYINLWRQMLIVAFYASSFTQRIDFLFTPIHSLLTRISLNE